MVARKSSRATEPETRPCDREVPEQAVEIPEGVALTQNLDDGRAPDRSAGWTPAPDPGCGHRHASGTQAGPRPRFAEGLAEHPTSRQVLPYVSFGHPTFSALYQAGVADKVADTLLWVLFPLYLHGHGLGMVQVGWVTGVYGLS